MKIVHIESGLGNQMLSYCEFLALKNTNPEKITCAPDFTINTNHYF